MNHPTASQSNCDPQLVKDHIKGRLLQFVETCTEFRSSTSLADDALSEKADLVDRIKSSDGFRRWKTEVLRPEIDVIAASAESSRKVSRTTTGECESTSYSIGHFGGRFTSTLPSFDCQNDEDEHQQQPLYSGLSVALTSTLGASAFAFMGRNYLKHAIDILTARPIKVQGRQTGEDSEDAMAKYDTIQALGHLPASEICESEYWPEFKVALRKLLDDDSRSQQRLSIAILGILVKLFNGFSHVATVDAFCLLADHLREKVFGSNRIRYVVKDGQRLEFEKDTGRYAIQKLRVLDEMALGFTRVLPRYCQQHRLEVAEKMITLLDLVVDNEEAGSVLTPFMAWSLVDPDIKWWRSWMHGRLGRAAVLSALGKHWYLVEFLLKTALDAGDEAALLNRSNKAAAATRTPGKRLSILQAATASWMVEGLLMYEEARLFLGERISNFPEYHLDRLLKNAVEGGQQSKFAWKINFAFAMNAHGRSLFFEERRLRRIAAELLNKERKYQIKIKLLNLISQFLKCFDYSPETTVKIFESSLVYRDGEASFSQLAMAAISDFISAAYSRDPDAPLSLVYACFDTCVIFCRTHLGRRLVSAHPKFLLLAVKLVKEHSVEVGTLLPILALVSVDDSTCDAVLKKFLQKRISRPDGKNVGEYLWHRPLELSQNIIQAFANRFTNLKSKISHLDNDSEILRYLDLLTHQVFLILCHADGSKWLLKNETFTQELLEPFRNEVDFQETNKTQICLKLLNFALHSPDFSTGLCHRFDLARQIAEVLNNYYALDDWRFENPDSCPKYLVQNSFSTELVDIYQRLTRLGGSTERLVLGQELVALDEILSVDSENYQGRAQTGPTVAGRPPLAETVEGGDLLKFFIGCLERKEQVRYSDVLFLAVKKFAVGDETAGSSHEEGCSTSGSRLKLYGPVLEYGKNLGILDPESASTTILASFLEMVHGLCSTSADTEEVDWFAAVVFLIFGGNAGQAAEFLQKFSHCDSVTLKCIWPKMSFPDFMDALKQVASLVDIILENELPKLLTALTVHGITSTNLVTFWLHQCFVNALDWTQICNYVILAVLGGPKFQAVLCCCLCYQMSDDICARAHGKSGSYDLHSFLFGPISFKLEECIPFLSYLMEKYTSM